MLIAIEGIDGAGKSTLIQRLKSRLPSDKYIFCSEFQSPIKDNVKALLHEDATFFLKTYFFAADRAWTYKKIALPAIEAGRIVIWDRYVDSALAYRFAELDNADIINFNFVKEINKPFRKADITIYLKMPAENSAERAASAGRKEPYNMAFLKQVGQYYDNVARRNSSYRIVDATKTENEITDEVIAIITQSQNQTKSSGLVINAQRIDQLVKMMNEAFKSSYGLFKNQGDLLENQIPYGVSKGSKEHALFMFYIVQNDHGVKSFRMYEKAKELYHINPEYFNPTWISEHFQEDNLEELVENVAKQIGSRYPQALAKSWYCNSIILQEKYDGNPMNMFISSDDATILIKTIKSFRGYGTKIGGMLLRAIVGVGFNKSVKNLDKVLVPVDIHDSRILFLTGGFNDPTYKTQGFDYYKYVQKAQAALLDACNRCNISWLDVDRALWLTGSRGCSYNKCEMCCIKTICEGRGTVHNEQTLGFL